jgi:hypothetical protein
MALKGAAMPITVRNLAGVMARELFGRKEAIGWELIRKFQEFGYFDHGTRGGDPADAPMAGSAHALALFFALRDSDFGPTKACERTLALLEMRPTSPPVLAVYKPEKGGFGRGMHTPIPDFVPPVVFATLCEHLSKAVAARRCGFARDNCHVVGDIQFMRFPENPLMLAALSSPFMPVGDISYGDAWSYGGAGRAANPAPPFEKSDTQTIDGAGLTAYLAEKLGPAEVDDKGELVSDVVALRDGARLARPVWFPLSSEMFMPNWHAFVRSLGAQNGVGA